MADPYETDEKNWLLQAAAWAVSLWSGCAPSSASSWQEWYSSRCLNGKRWDGTQCPGVPDSRRMALAFSRDQGMAAEIATQLRAWNEGYAPTPQELTNPYNAFLAGFALAGGIDCYNSRDPGYLEAFRRWVESETPDWTPPAGGEPGHTPTDPGETWWRELATEAIERGEDALAAVLQEAARMGYGALPDSARRALAGLGIDYHRGQLAAAVPFVVGGVIIFALIRARGRS